VHWAIVWPNCLSGPAIFGSFGESFLGFSEEARTRGFPSLPFGGFGFVVIYCPSFIRRVAGKILIVGIFTRFSSAQERPLWVITSHSFYTQVNGWFRPEAAVGFIEHHNT
jgi:hypothetical protein